MPRPRSPDERGLCTTVGAFLSFLLLTFLRFLYKEPTENETSIKRGRLSFVAAVLRKLVGGCDRKDVRLKDAATAFAIEISTLYLEGNFLYVRVHVQY